MATLQTFPDILITLFAHPSLSVADLFKCERVCQQWLQLLRAGQNQIWKQKLVEAFPEGCLPVLYGHEVWRDVAVLWCAWRRPWTPAEEVAYLEGEYIEELEPGKVLPRKAGRDLVT
ncbi:hypothetical protein HDV00_005361, partial [Rhizophlyctis rosea]